MNIMKNRSEEWCGECDTTFLTDTIVSICPNCKEVVISCDNCDNLRCGNCFYGKNFYEFIPNKGGMIWKL